MLKSLRHYLINSCLISGLSFLSVNCSYKKSALFNIDYFGVF